MDAKRHAIVYVPGQGGNAAEAERFRPRFPDADVIGLDYRATTPWEARSEFSEAFERLLCDYEKITLVANSIGAWLCMCAHVDAFVDRAFLISPIVDMAALIEDMMARTHVSEDRLRSAGTIALPSGEELSWAYLSYVRHHPITWHVRTSILYGSEDHLTSPQTIRAFARDNRFPLTVMEGAPHWFHTDEQLAYLDAWLLEGLAAHGDTVSDASPHA